MALSEKEQELLAQMEAALAADDPRLANTLRGQNVRTLHRRQASLAMGGFLAGMTVLIAGMSVHWSVSVLGFVMMLGAFMLARASLRHVNPTEQVRSQIDDDLRERFEERWRRLDEN